MGAVSPRFMAKLFMEAYPVLKVDTSRIQSRRWPSGR